MGNESFSEWQSKLGSPFAHLRSVGDQAKLATATVALFPRRGSNLQAAFSETRFGSGPKVRPDSSPWSRGGYSKERREQGESERVRKEHSLLLARQ